MSEQTCCAHCKVVLKHKDYPDGTRSDYWECADGCGAKFISEQQLATERLARKQAEKRAEVAEKACAEMRDAFVDLSEYWNGNGDSAAIDAAEHSRYIAETMLDKTTVGSDYVHKSQVEALQFKYEELNRKYCASIDCGGPERGPVCGACIACLNRELDAAIKALEGCNKAHADYIALLDEELTETISWALPHGWTSKRVEAGELGRKRIADAIAAAEKVIPS